MPSSSAGPETPPDAPPSDFVPDFDFNSMKIDSDDPSVNDVFRECASHGTMLPSKISTKLLKPIVAKAVVELYVRYARKAEMVTI